MLHKISCPYTEKSAFYILVNCSKLTRGFETEWAPGYSKIPMNDRDTFSHYLNIKKPQQNMKTASFEGCSIHDYWTENGFMSLNT